MSLPFDVWVLTCRDREAQTPGLLRQLGLPFRVWTNPDWRWPLDHPELTTDRGARPSLRPYALRAYRAFRGHQEILRRADRTRPTLVFEDDASLAPDVTADEVRQHLLAATQLLRLGPYDAISFHGRRLSPSRPGWMLGRREYVELQSAKQTGGGHLAFLSPVIQGPAYNRRYAHAEFRWHEGALAYLIDESGRRQWLAAGHGHGLPCDLYLANELRLLVLRETFFVHDQRNGSVLTGTAKRDQAD